MRYLLLAVLLTGCSPHDFPLDRADMARIKEDCAAAGGKATFTYYTEGYLAGHGKNAKCLIPEVSE